MENFKIVLTMRKVRYSMYLKFFRLQFIKEVLNFNVPFNHYLIFSSITKTATSCRNNFKQEDIGDMVNHEEVKMGW